MKKLIRDYRRNSGILLVELEPDFQNELKNKLFAALRKFSSSRKTKAVHKNIENDTVKPALFNGEASQYLVSPVFKNSVINMITFNVFFFDDSLDQKGAVTYAAKIINVGEKIQKEKTFVTERQLYNLERLQAEKEEMQEKFLASLDYIKLVDGIYFGWLLFLSFHMLKNDSDTKAKIVTIAADILASILKQMYLKINTKIEPETHQLLEAISIYFIRLYFYGESSQYVLHMMKKAFDEEILEAIKLSKVTRFKKFNELSLILRETQLLAITETTFDLQMQKMFGKYAYEQYIQDYFHEFIAFMANLAHPTQIFKDSYEVDKDIHLRLEELLLNEQKKITFFNKRNT